MEYMNKFKGIVGVVIKKEGWIQGHGYTKLVHFYLV